jgi:hypothetical protein
MQDKEARIPRWLVESDPSWEKSIDSDLGMMRWTKKGTGIQAICAPTSMFCEIVGDSPGSAGLSDIAANMSRIGSKQANLAAGAGDIAKYLSSRYLNPAISGPRFDLKKMRQE